MRSSLRLTCRLADDIDTGGIDEYNPVWNVLDLTPARAADERDDSEHAALEAAMKEV